MVRFTTPPFSRLAAALTALVVAGSLQADPPRQKVRPPQPAVHQMELLNGASRTVRSFGIGLSTSEAASLSDLDRLENEGSFVHDLQALKRQYVLSERLLEPHRRLVQQDLYGRAVTTSNYGSLTSAGFGYPGYYNYGVGGFGYGYNAPAAYTTGTTGAQTTVVRSLADGVGDEGVLKANLAAVIAKEAAQGYAASVAAEYRQAVAAAAVSPTLRAGLRLQSPDELRKADNAIRAVDYEAPVANRVTLTLANGQKVVGTNLQEGKDWITLVRADGGTSRYRLSQVTQIDLPAAGGGKVAPAVDK